MSDPRKFIVVGAGGVGGWLCEGLARMLEFKFPGSALVIVDGDNFEAKNAERQNFEDVGNKATVRARALQPLFPSTFIIPDDRWVVPESVEVDEGGASGVTPSVLMDEGDVVFATVDNFAARKLLFDAAREYENISIFTGGNDDDLSGSTYHYMRRDGKDVTDHPAEYHPELLNPSDRNPGELSCQERAELEGGTQLLATNMAVAAFLLGRTQKVIVDGEEDTESEIKFDLGLGMSLPYDRAAVPVSVPV